MSCNEVVTAVVLHPCQTDVTRCAAIRLELEYVGVIIGPDLIVRDGQVITQPAKRVSQDRTIFGWKKRLKENPKQTTRQLDLIIKNTYRTLMTHGMKGCYVFSEDHETRAYLRGRLRSEK